MILFSHSASTTTGTVTSIPSCYDYYYYYYYYYHLPMVETILKSALSCDPIAKVTRKMKGPANK